MPLGSSSAAPAIRPGPSCFSSGSRAAGFPAATETPASFSPSSTLAQVLRQAVIGIALLELAQLALGLGRLTLGLELANILQPFFRRALTGFGNRETARARGSGTRVLARCRGLRKRACRRSRSPRRL